MIGKWSPTSSLISCVSFWFVTTISRELRIERNEVVYNLGKTTKNRLCLVTDSIHQGRFSIYRSLTMPYSVEWICAVIVSAWPWLIPSGTRTHHSGLKNEAQESQDYKYGGYGSSLHGHYNASRSALDVRKLSSRHWLLIHLFTTVSVDRYPVLLLRFPTNINPNWKTGVDI